MVWVHMGESNIGYFDDLLAVFEENALITMSEKVGMVFV